MNASSALAACHPDADGGLLELLGESDLFRGSGTSGTSKSFSLLAELPGLSLDELADLAGVDGDNTRQQPTRNLFGEAPTRIYKCSSCRMPKRPRDGQVGCQCPRKKARPQVLHTTVMASLRQAKAAMAVVKSSVEKPVRATTVLASGASLQLKPSTVGVASAVKPSTVVAASAVKPGTAARMLPPSAQGAADAAARGISARPGTPRYQHGGKPTARGLQHQNDEEKQERGGFFVLTGEWPHHGKRYLTIDEIDAYFDDTKNATCAKPIEPSRPATAEHAKPAAEPAKPPAESAKLAEPAESAKPAKAAAVSYTHLTLPTNREV